MPTYCCTDLHGCLDEFMELLEQIKFDTKRDTLYILGDCVDRGDRPVDCLLYAWKTPHVHMLLGNHEAMMLDHFATSVINERWFRNGNGTTLAQLEALSEADRDALLDFVRTRPLYKTVNMNGKRYFLAHAGLDAFRPFSRQDRETLTWIRQDFFERKALPRHTVVFGHSTTPHIRGNQDCSVWFDPLHKDKIGIDGGCCFGGALIALRLDDEAVFYVKSKRKDPPRSYSIGAVPTVR